MCGWMRYICDGRDIYVMNEIYMWWMRYMIVWIYLSWWNVKIKNKNCRFGLLCRVLHLAKDPVAKCHGHSTRQSWKMGARKTVFLALPSAMTMALGKDFFKKRIQTLPSARQRALDKEILKKNSNFTECQPECTRQRIFFKKNSNFAERRPGGTRQRIFRKKNKTSLPRVG